MLRSLRSIFLGGVLLAGCAAPDSPVDAGTGTGASTPTLRWYTTCGDVICRAPADAGTADAGTVDAGSCPAIGSACATKGQTCGTASASNCGVIQVCDDHDPKAMGCPISSRQFKDDIQYLDASALQQLHDEAIRLRLATYNYKSAVADPNSRHLGFIVEDAPRSLAVDRGHDRVDMYGYVSLVVAAMQVQEREIAQLRHELDVARLGACPAAPRK
jgi:hypothetical protein